MKKRSLEEKTAHLFSARFPGVAFSAPVGMSADGKVATIKMDSPKTLPRLLRE
jgi:hypothetical protein